MRIALVLEDDYATRRAIAELLLRDGYGVCEGFQADPIPFVPALDVIVTDVVMRPEIEAVRLWGPLDDGALRRARRTGDRPARVRVRRAERARRRRRRCKTVRHYGPVTARAQGRRQRAGRARRAHLELAEHAARLLHIPCDLRAEVRRTRERHLVA